MMSNPIATITMADGRVMTAEQVEAEIEAASAK